MGKTLFEMLKSKVTGPVEFQLDNPLKVRVGGCMTIKDIDLRGLTFFVKEVREMTRTVGNAQYVSTDYDLLARPLGADEVKIRVRLNPRDKVDAAAGLRHNVVLLKLYDELAYDEGLHNAVNDTTKIFDVRENGVVTEQYWRINDVTGPYEAVVRSAKEGAKDLNDLVTEEIQYWDYWREIKDEAGQAFNQFMFVEMNKENGWFQLWRGQEIDPQNVTVV